MQRDNSIDVARSTYIVMMIVYHCFTQANKLDPGFIPDINKYLLLVSGSFPFLAGFLVGHHYLKQSFAGASDTASRLFIRGSRLLLIYLVSNIAIVYVLTELSIQGVVSKSDNHLASIFSVNPVEVIYDILVPLGLTLMAGAMLVYSASKIGRGKYQNLHYFIPAAIGLAMAIDGEHPYMACGLIGIAVGNNSLDELIVSTYRRYRTLVYVSLLYGLALAIYSEDPRFAGVLYLAGVMSLFYALRSFNIDATEQSKLIARERVLYSKHSLLIYLVHVPLIVIIVTQTLVPVNMFSSEFLFAALLMIIFVSMSLLIRLVDHLYTTSINFKKLYNFVFG